MVGRGRLMVRPLVALLVGLGLTVGVPAAALAGPPPEEPTTTTTAPAVTTTTQPTGVVEWSTVDATNRLRREVVAIGGVLVWAAGLACGLLVFR